MRISLQATSLESPSFQHFNNVPLAVTIKPANNLPGSFDFQTNSTALLKLLRQKTDVSDGTLENFHDDLRFTARSRIAALTLKDEVLQEIGYFID